MQIGKYKAKHYKSAITNRQMQIGKDTSANTSREIQVGSYNSENINRKTGINKMHIGKYKSGSPSLYSALPPDTVQNTTLC